MALAFISWVFPLQCKAVWYLTVKHRQRCPPSPSSPRHICQVAFRNQRKEQPNSSAHPTEAFAVIGSDNDWG